MLFTHAFSLGNYIQYFGFKCLLCSKDAQIYISISDISPEFQIIYSTVVLTSRDTWMSNRHLKSKMFETELLPEFSSSWQNHYPPRFSSCNLNVPPVLSPSVFILPLKLSRIQSLFFLCMTITLDQLASSSSWTTALCYFKCLKSAVLICQCRHAKVLQTG